MMTCILQALSDPATAIIVSGALVTLVLQGLKKLWPWLANRATPNKKRWVAALGVAIATVALQALAGKTLADVDWAEVVKIAAAAFGVATGAHTLTVSTAYKAPKEGSE